MGSVFCTDAVISHSVNPMKPSILYLCVLLFTSCATSCNSVEPDNTFKGQSLNVKIKPGERKQLETDVWVTFVERTSDSRCPVNVECIWEGEVNVLFNIEGPLGTDTLRVKGFVGPAGEDPVYVGLPTVQDHWFYLNRLDPYPGVEEGEPVATISLLYNRARTVDS